MKRKSILILAAALMLAVSIPMFAFAESEIAVQPLDGTGNMFGQRNAQALAQGDRLQLQDCDLLEDCDCEAEGIGLGNDGEALHQYAVSTLRTAQSNSAAAAPQTQRGSANVGRGRK